MENDYVRNTLLQRNALRLYIDGWISKLHRTPLVITLFVTSRCNAKCPFCFYAKHNTGELSLGNIKQIAATIGKFSYLNISGGEPFLRNDLDEICKVFCEKSEILYLNIPTNSTLPERVKTKTEKILKGCPDTLVAVVLTLLGSPKEHDRLLGVKDAYKKFLKTYGYLQEMRRKYKNLILNINFTFSHHNQSILYQTYKNISKQLNPDNFTITLVRGNTRDKISVMIDIDRYKNIISLMDKDALAKSSSIFGRALASRRSLMHKINIKIHNEKKQIIPCFAGYTSAVITETGDVYPCELLPNKLGDLRDVDYDFQRIWHSKEMYNTRKWIKNNHCFCTHECNLPINITYSLKGNLLWLLEWIRK